MMKKIFGRQNLSFTKCILFSSKEMEKSNQDVLQPLSTFPYNLEKYTHFNCLFPLFFLKLEKG